MNDELMTINPSTPIGDLFHPSTPAPTFEGDTIVQTLLEYFCATRADAAVISDNARHVGILTHKDLLEVLLDYDNLGLPVREFMSSPVSTFPSDTPIASVIDAIEEAPYDKIVAASGEKLVGVIDRRHLLALCYRKITPIVRNELPMLHSLMKLADEEKMGLLKMATTDSLTGIGNRRLFEEVFLAYRNSTFPDEHPLYFLLFDIDNFKSINDTFGHNVGDSVLRELASLVGRSIRKSDTFARWGGEEFALLQRYSDPMAVMKVAEQIRKKIDEHSFETIVHVTCSFGLTAVLPHEAFETAFERADKALYRAKNDGKNCIRIEMP